MSQYGQFCPIAKATELLGERWTLLVIRELMLGTRRYSDFQRALSRISPTLLTKRLRQLEQAGILIRKQKAGAKGSEYYLTPAGKELSPVIEHMAIWGMRWARGQLTNEELDVEFLMWDIQRRIDTDKLPDGETVLCFIFSDLEQYRNWWLVIEDGETDVCTENPGKDVDLYVTSTLRKLVEIWEGDIDVGAARRQKLIKTQGNRQLEKTIGDWMGINPFADIRPGDPELMKIAAED
jgi:DNA-binding HxlR family transcriptional regulator